VHEPAEELKLAVGQDWQTEAEVIPIDKLGKGMVTRAAYDYTDRHLGPRSEIGDKGKSLARRLRAVLAG
jgi:hypothetical protein